MTRCRSAHSQHQRGIVLIMALLIVALVTTVVVSISWRFNLSMARNENRWHGSQARVHLEAAEQFALQGLRLDVELAGGTRVDSLREQWAQPLPQAPTDFGYISGLLEDGHGRLNLNLMVSVKPPDPPASRPPRQELYSNTQRMFIRFVQTIELESGSPVDVGMAMELVDAIEDWLDIDSITIGSGGAESSYYESMDPPYPITNGEMATVSELALVKGMTPELFQKLQPYVIALPGYKDPQNAVLPNINTLKPELLRGLNNTMVFEPLDDATFQMILGVRDAANPEAQSPGFQNVDEFLSAPELSSLWQNPPPYKAVDFTVESRYFLLFAEALVGEQVRRSKSLLYRPPGGQGGLPRVVRRTDANF